MSIFSICRNNVSLCNSGYHDVDFYYPCIREAHIAHFKLESMNLRVPQIFC